MKTTGSCRSPRWIVLKPTIRSSLYACFEVGASRSATGATHCVAGVMRGIRPSVASGKRGRRTGSSTVAEHDAVADTDAPETTFNTGSGNVVHSVV